MGFSAGFDAISPTPKRGSGMDVLMNESGKVDTKLNNKKLLCLGGTGSVLKRNEKRWVGFSQVRANVVSVGAEIERLCECVS